MDHLSSTQTLVLILMGAASSGWYWHNRADRMRARVARHDAWVNRKKYRDHPAAKKWFGLW